MDQQIETQSKQFKTGVVVGFTIGTALALYYRKHWGWFMLGGITVGGLIGSQIGHAKKKTSEIKLSASELNKKTESNGNKNTDSIFGY